MFRGSGRFFSLGFWNVGDPGGRFPWALSRCGDPSDISPCVFVEFEGSGRRFALAMRGVLSRLHRRSSCPFPNTVLGPRRVWPERSATNLRIPPGGQPSMIGNRTHALRSEFGDSQLSIAHLKSPIAGPSQGMRRHSAVGSHVRVRVTPPATRLPLGCGPHRAQSLMV